MTLGIAAVAALALLFWCVAWLCGFLGSRLPKRDWKRWPLMILFPGSMGAIIVGQFAVLTVLVSERFSRNSSFYVVMIDCPIAIVLMFYTAIREERKKKELATRQGDGAATASFWPKTRSMK
jgi:hypothetical protein